MSPIDREARSLAENLGWKLNLVLAGVGSTFAMVVGLAVWTLQRVDAIARDVREIATQTARVEARDVASEARKEIREEVSQLLATRR